MVIQLSGKAGSGKNQYAEYLKQALEAKGKKVNIIAYRDILKDLCNDMYQKLKPYFKDQYKFENIDNSLKDNQKGMELRRAWWLSGGRYIKKYFGGLIWVNSLFTQQFIEQNFYYPQYLENFTIIADLRFKNQFEFARKHQYTQKIKLIRIWRQGHIGTSQKFLKDKSQIDLDDIKENDWDEYVLNNGDLNKLKENAYQYVNNLLQTI